MSGADAADSTTPAPIGLSGNDVPLGQQPGFVAPRTYLEQTRPIQPPKPLTALDREQMEGLVCVAKRCWEVRANISFRNLFAPS
jgi:hypothetical protein